jgi:glutamyl-tRNA reductase
MTVGLNYRMAPAELRERFRISESRRYQALVELLNAEGIEEVVVLATDNLTEFLLWATDVTLAANSVMRFLGAEYGFKLGEWKHFYRLLDEAALLHIFRVASNLDDPVLVGEPQVVLQVKDAWKQAQKAGACGRSLDAILQKALEVSERVRTETGLGNEEDAAFEREAAVAEAQKILQAEMQGFRNKLMADRVVPTIVSLRMRLDELCRQELDSFREQNGPFSKDQDEMLSAMMSRMTQRIAASLARELRELPEKVEQEQMTIALQRLFHLSALQTANSA